jgi:hypothetical protein
LRKSLEFEADELSLPCTTKVFTTTVASGMSVTITNVAGNENLFDTWYEKLNNKRKVYGNCVTTNDTTEKNENENFQSVYSARMLQLSGK